MLTPSPIDRVNDRAIGAIVSVHGPVVVIACEHLPPLRRALRAHVDGDTYLFEVHQHLEHHARAITLHQSAGLPTPRKLSSEPNPQGGFHRNMGNGFWLVYCETIA